MKNKYPVYVVSFSHLDLFWAGTREECLSRGNYIISKALDLLDEYDDFRFLIETNNFLDNYVSCYPYETDRISKLIKSGQLEIAPLWCGIYQNLPAGETIARNILYAKKYAEEMFNCNPDTAHFGDLPGYTPQFPQIAKLSGIKNVVMSRGGPSETPLFFWEAHNGDKIKAFYVVNGYAFYAMHTTWHKQFKDMISGRLEKTLINEISGRKHASLIHWGSDLYAPHENIIKNVRQWNETKDIELKFSTLSNFFDSASNNKNLPTLNGEIPSSWPNIEASWPDVWAKDIPCQAALHMAEMLSVICILNGWNDYPSSELEDAWKALLDSMDHNQNSQGALPADKDKLQLKLYSQYAAERIIDKMAWRIAGQIPAEENKLPVVVFNSMSWKRTEVVHARVAFYDQVRATDIFAFDDGIKLIDENNKTVPYVQLHKYQALSQTMEFAFCAEDVPACGYKTYYIVPGENPIFEKTCHIKLDSEVDQDPNATYMMSTEKVCIMGPRRPQGSNNYENDFYKLTIDTITGEVDIFDKTAQKLIFEKAAIVAVEERRGNYISEMTPSGREFPAIIDSIENIDNNHVWTRIKIAGSIHSMPFTQTITLYKKISEIHIENNIDWQKPRWIRIQQIFPYTEKKPAIRYGVPFGFVTYPEVMYESKERFSDEVDKNIISKIRLCLNWIDVEGETSLTIGSDHRMWEFDNKNILRSYMIRGNGFCSAVDVSPDGKMKNIERPPPGQYTFKYTIKGRTDAFEQSCPYRTGWQLNNPLKSVAVSGNNGKPALPCSYSIVDFTDTSIITTAIKKQENGYGIIIRAFETSGKECSPDLSEITDRFSVSETDILEKTKNKQTKFKAFDIKTFLMKYKK